MLLEDARIGDICFDESDRSLWGLRHLNGYVTLVRIPYPYTSWNQVHTWPYGDEPFELDVSADGSLLSMTIGTIDGTQFLNVFRRADLEAGKVEPIARFDFGKAIPEGFVFTRDGRYLYGSSYFTGVSNIFRFELATRRTRGGQQRGDRLLPPDPDGRRNADRPGIHRGRLRADDHRSEAAGRCQRHHLSRGADREQAPDRQGVGRWPA